MMRRLQTGLRTLRNHYFWMVAASLIFVVAMTFLPSVPLRHGDSDNPTGDDEPAAHVPPFFAGFLAASVLVGFWTFDYGRRHAKWTNTRSKSYLDQDCQRVWSTFCFTEGNKWPWVALLQEMQTGNMHMVELEADNRENDLAYVEDIHIAPCKVSEDAPLGSHRYTRVCPCIPVIMEQLKGRTLVIHRENDHRTTTEETI